jgi:hypothetical protein
MWIICCGMIRSGSTLQYQLTKEIVESDGQGIGVGWMDKDQLRFELQKTTNEKKIKVVKCHEYFKEAGDFISSHKAKGIYVYRDLRDILVSLMNKKKQPFGSVFSVDRVNSLIDMDRKWNGIETLYVSKYEEVMSNLAAEIVKIASFLKISVDKSFVTEIEQKHSIENQQKRIFKFDYTEMGTDSGDSIYDPDTLLHDNHIHSGKIHQWETELSRFQIALLENIAYEWLIERNYPISKSRTVRKLAKFLFHFLSAN